MNRKFRAIGLVAASLALVLSLAIPSMALADSKAPISCSITLAVTNPGVTTVVGGNKVKTEGEQSLGALDCDDNSFDGAFATVHDSKVTVGLDGSLSGKLKGTFTVTTVTGIITGDLQADISGVVIAVVPPGYPVHQVTDVGTWKFDHDGVKGKGTFALTLVGIIGAPYPYGLATPVPGSLVGEVKLD